ncbi:hypothetical protein ACXZ1K_15565 [Pedobacter sp. PWIIR3]
MRQFKSWCLLLTLVALSIKGFSQSTTVGARLDKSDILLGGQTTLRLSASLPANGKITFPALSDTISSKIQIVEIGKLDTLKEESGRWKISRTYTITAFDAGVLTVPAFKFIGPDGELLTDPLPLQVEEVKVDTTKGVYDIKQPMTVKYGFIDWLKDNGALILLGFFLAILLIGLWFYYHKRRKKQPVIQEVKPLVPPHVTAIKKLEELRDKRLWQQEEVKLYYSELTDIVREYLEKRYGIPAMEQTSDEIFTSLMKLDVTEENKVKLREVLLLADLVKFAKQKPVAADNEASMESAMLFVKKSIIVNQPENQVQHNDGLN